MNAPTRRQFIQTLGAGATLAAIAQARPAAAAPSERVRHAVIGTGGQGQQHVHQFSSQPDCDVVAICDVDPERRAKALSRLPNGAQAKDHGDFRHLLDNPEIDSVSIATPDHWHTPVALWALQAGKHVYVEKPCSHNVRESVLLIEAAAKSGKCVMQGTQSRSGQGNREAIQWLHEGNLGKIRTAKAINHQYREAIGRAPESAPPENVNYDLWLGPAPLRPFTQNRWHYNWHWHWDYGTGDIGNDGVHQIDVARWGLDAKWPKAISASGGQLFYDDDHETPDYQVVTFEYDACILIYEMRLWTDYTLEGHHNGVVFYGDEGTLQIGQKDCIVTMKGEEPREIPGGPDLPGHVRNFLDCVKASAPDKLNAPISEGAISAALPHFGNIATRVGRRLHFDLDKLACTGDEEATKLLSREYRAGYELPQG